MVGAFRAIIFSIILTWGLVGPAAAGPYEDGEAAFQRRDYAEALRNWRPLAERGNPSVQHNLGVIYYNGMGVRKSYVEAARWLKIAANQGHANSMHDLGLMYEQARRASRLCGGS